MSQLVTHLCGIRSACSVVVDSVPIENECEARNPTGQGMTLVGSEACIVDGIILLCDLREDEVLCLVDKRVFVDEMAVICDVTTFLIFFVG